MSNLGIIVGAPPSTRDQALTQQSSSYRLSNGQTLGPSRANWGHLASTRTVQGMVTTNVGVNKELYKRRRAANEGVAEGDRISTVNDENDLDVHPHELVFAFKAPGTRRTGGAGAIYGFTSFNGLITTAFKGSQDDFEENFRFLGRAKIPFNFNSPEQGDHGVSVQVRGACTTPNRGEHEFFPKDIVRWCLPSIDKETRQAEQQRFHRPEGMPEHKMLAHLRPVTFSDIYRIPESAYARYREVASAPNGDAAVRSRNVGLSTSAHPERIVRFAISYFRAAGITKMFSALAVLVEKGLVTISDRVPEDATVAAGYAAFSAVANAPLAQAPATSAQAAGRLATLAYALDIVPARPRDVHIRPATRLIADVLAAQNKGFAPAKDARHTEVALSRLLGSAKVTVGTQFLEQLDSAQENTVRREAQTFSEFYASEMEKVVGVAISHAFAGEMLDVLL